MSTMPTVEVASILVIMTLVHLVSVVMDTAMAFPHKIMKENWDIKKRNVLYLLLRFFLCDRHIDLQICEGVDYFISFKQYFYNFKSKSLIPFFLNRSNELPIC